MVVEEGAFNPGHPINARRGIDVVKPKHVRLGIPSKILERRFIKMVMIFYAMIFLKQLIQNIHKSAF